MAIDVDKYVDIESFSAPNGFPLPSAGFIPGNLLLLDRTGVFKLLNGFDFKLLGS